MSFSRSSKPHRGGVSAPTSERLCRDVEEVREDAADLAEQHAQQLATARRLDAHHLLDGEHEGVLLVHRRAIIEAVEIRDILKVGARLHQLLGAAMQQTDMRIHTLDNLAVEFENEAQNAMRRWMLRAEVKREVARAGAAGGERRCREVRVAAGHRWPSCVPAFSSPGRMYSPEPSQGDRKSNERNAWLRLTGSVTTRFCSSSQRTST